MDIKQLLSQAEGMTKTIKDWFHAEYCTLHTDDQNSLHMGLKSPIGFEGKYFRVTYSKEELECFNDLQRLMENILGTFRETILDSLANERR